MWLSAVAWLIVIVSVAISVRMINKFLASDRHFVLSSRSAEGPHANGLTVEGVVHASPARIARVFASDFGRSIFLIPLAERRRRLLAVDWIEEASVSRIWPDRVVVRIAERKPVAFVNFKSAGAVSHAALIDTHGILLDRPPHTRFSFPVLNGISDQQTEAERRDRVSSMLRILSELGHLGKDVSEINISSPRNVKIVARVEDRAVELSLGDRNFASRFQNFLNHYAEIRKRSGRLTGFDLRLDDRITAKE